MYHLRPCNTRGVVVQVSVSENRRCNYDHSNMTASVHQEKFGPIKIGAIKNGQSREIGNTGNTMERKTHHNMCWTPLYANKHKQCK